MLPNMGSSQSHPVPPSTPNRRESSPHPPLRRPLSALRRFSSLGRPDRDAAKRIRHRSPGGMTTGKKARLEDLSIQDEETSGSSSRSPPQSSGLTSEVTSVSSIAEQVDNHPSPVEQIVLAPPIATSVSIPLYDPLVPTPSERISVSTESPSPLHPPVFQPPALRSDRTSPITSPSSNTVPRPLRRQSFPLTPSPNDERSMSNRLSAFLGFSTPTPPQPGVLPPDVEAEVVNMNVEQLRARLSQAREDLANTQRLLSETQSRIDAANARRIPHGAVLVIQGLAQTNTVEDDTEAASTSEESNAGQSRISRRQRRSSDSSAQRPRLRQTPSTEPNVASLETQARMIGALLTCVFFAFLGAL